MAVVAPSPTHGSALSVGFLLHACHTSSHPARNPIHMPVSTSLRDYTDCRCGQQASNLLFTTPSGNSHSLAAEDAYSRTKVPCLAVECTRKPTPPRPPRPPTQTMSFYAKHSHHHRGIFVVVALGLAGLCSLFPLMCFKGVSSKEKARLKQDVADLEAKQKEEEKWIRENMPRVRPRSHSPPKIAHAPHHRHRQHHGRRHSTDHHRRRRHEEGDEFSEMQYPHRHRRRSESRHTNDRHLDEERRRRHHGHPPPRRYHHSS